MEEIIDRIKQIAEKISKTEEKRTKLAQFLLGINTTAGLTKMVPQDKITESTIAAVDGGIVKKSFHGFDFMLVRAASVCFHYKDNKIHNVEYLPSRHPSPEPEIFESVSDLDWNYLCSLCRLHRELKIANMTIEKKPDILLLDGMLIPHYSDKPSKSSITYDYYNSLVSEYKALYEKSLNNGTILAGVIKDSRSVTFCDFVRKEILSKVNHPETNEIMDLLSKTRDTNLLFLILKRGERSKIFSYSKTPSEHPILKDMGKYSEYMHSFYLRTAKWDRPLRIDVLIPENKDKSAYADRLASALLAISGQHAGYGLPTPLIEADNTAKLSDSELDDFYFQVLNLTGYVTSTMDLRRTMRPF